MGQARAMRSSPSRPLRAVQAPGSILLVDLAGAPYLLRQTSLLIGKVTGSKRNIWRSRYPGSRCREAPQKHQSPRSTACACAASLPSCIIPPRRTVALALPTSCAHLSNDAFSSATECSKRTIGQGRTEQQLLRGLVLRVQLQRHQSVRLCLGVPSQG